jgi:hypothetical protein
MKRSEVVDALSEFRNVIPLHQRKDPSSYRPQPARTGSDYWPTIDRGLQLMLIHRVLCVVPPGIIWEPAAGAGHLVDPLRQAGREVIATDLFPQRDDVAVHDFLYGAPPNTAAGSIMMTNPPNSRLTQFTVRGLTLLDTGYLTGFALLTRLGADTTKARGAAFNRAAYAWKTCWRPYWKPRQKGDRQPRWTAQWTLWLRDRPGPPIAVCLTLDELVAPELPL